MGSKAIKIKTKRGQEGKKAGGQAKILPSKIKTVQPFSFSAFQHGVCLLFAICYLLFAFPVYSQESCPIVQADNIKLVRVGISDTSFKSLVYKETPIIATADYAAYDKISRKLIAKFGVNDVLKIKRAAGAYELSVNGRLIAKNYDTIVIDCPTGLIGIQNLKRNGHQATYHGVFELTPKNDDTFYLINVLDLENYLKGVVPNEMPVRFGLEALKAQAVAARNYVLLPRTKCYREFDVDDSVASQVYFGAGTENPLSNQAIKETEGLVALYGWDLILAQYCSTAGGYTENYEHAFSDNGVFPSRPKPYLKGRPDILSVGPLNREEEARLFYMSYPDSYDIKSPYYRWQREWGGGVNQVNGIKELEDVLRKNMPIQSATGFVKPEFKQGDTFNELKELRVKKRGVSGKIMELEIVTDKEIYHVYKELVIRRLLTKDGKALPSANVVFENLYDTNKKLNKVVAYGGGLGHGVGMSQFGAGFMATSLHKPFDKILKRYYTGITISTIPTVLSSEQNAVTQSFFAPYKKAVLLVDNKYQIKEFKANINGRDVVLELANSIVPFNRISRIDISSYIKQGKNAVTFYFPECECNKGIKLYIELVEKDENEYSF